MNKAARWVWFGVWLEKSYLTNIVFCYMWYTVLHLEWEAPPTPIPPLKTFLPKTLCRVTAKANGSILSVCQANNLQRFDYFQMKRILVIIVDICSYKFSIQFCYLERISQYLNQSNFFSFCPIETEVNRIFRQRKDKSTQLHPLIEGTRFEN